MREPWLVLVPTWARADGLCGTPDMSPALNYKALLYATPTHLPSICPFTRPHVIISALSMHLPPVLWAWIRAPATHFLGARILTTLPLSIPPAAFSALPQHLPSPFSVIILSSQYLFQRGPIWMAIARKIHHLNNYFQRSKKKRRFFIICWKCRPKCCYDIFSSKVSSKTVNISSFVKCDLLHKIEVISGTYLYGYQFCQLLWNMIALS